MSHFWYRVLESRLPGPITVRLLAKKVLCDLMVAPAFSVTFIAGKTSENVDHSIAVHSGISMLEGKSVSASLSEYRSKFLRIFAVRLHSVALVRASHLVGPLRLALHTNLELLAVAATIPRHLRQLHAASLYMCSVIHKTQ